MYVDQVRRNSSANLTRIERGSVILEVMDISVSTVEEFIDEVAKHDLTKGVRVRVQNSDGFLRFELLELPE